MSCGDKMSCDEMRCRGKMSLCTEDEFVYGRWVCVRKMGCGDKMTSTFTQILTSKLDSSEN